MVDVNNWTVTCKKCGITYNIPKKGKITILSLKTIKLNKKHECPSCGHSSPIATLKHNIGYNSCLHSP
ncbi:hypothetical protein [Methanobacterium sp.]|uniref:hypothetical protein n=1 Tax=Methanobacterium sp. TaxID=2164 RepID=UPI003C7620BD